MKENYIHKSKFFYGNKISEYGLKHGYIDYRTLSKCFDMVLCNDITKLFYGSINGEIVLDICAINERIDNLQEQIDELQEPQDYPGEIFQYFIISDRGAEILKDLTNEILYYIPALNVYVWGVTHYGTSWDYVLTNIKIELDGGDE